MPRRFQVTCVQSPAAVAKTRFPNPANVICHAVALALPPAFQRLESTEPKAQLNEPPSKLSANHVSFLPIAPVAVRFGWANFPVVNLWNKDGIPASPFRTDDWSPVAAKAAAKK